MNRGKKLTIHYFTSTNFGPKTCQIGNWEGKAFFAKWPDLSQILYYPELNNSGLFLVKTQNKIDVHSSENLKEDLKNLNHNLKNNELVCLVNRFTPLNSNELEYLATRLSCEIKYKHFSNLKAKKKLKLKEVDISNMDCFLDHAKLILPVFGFTF